MNFAMLMGEQKSDRSVLHFHWSRRDRRPCCRICELDGVRGNSRHHAHPPATLGRVRGGPLLRKNWKKWLFSPKKGRIRYCFAPENCSAKRIRKLGKFHTGSFFCGTKKMHFSISLRHFCENVEYSLRRGRKIYRLTAKVAGFLQLFNAVRRSKIHSIVEPRSPI